MVRLGSLWRREQGIQQGHTSSTARLAGQVRPLREDGSVQRLLGLSGLRQEDSERVLVLVEGKVFPDELVDE